MDLERLNIGLSFIEHPTKKAFNGIIKDVNERELLEFIPVIFGSAPYMNCDTNWMLEAYNKCKNKIPKDKLWNILMSVYIHNGFDFPLELILEALPYRPLNHLRSLPSRYKGVDTVTVYRATSHNPQLYPPKYDLSWSLNPRTATEFYRLRYDYRSFGAGCHFYKANLKKYDILMCRDKRSGGEEEVLQYASITDLIEMPESRIDHEIALFDRMYKNA